jgi:hypothetical protein
LRQFAVRFIPRTGESQRSRTSHQRSGPIHSFDPSLSASTTTTALFPRRAHEIRNTTSPLLDRPNYAPLPTTAYNYSNNNNNNAKLNRPRTPNRIAPNSAAVPRINHSSVRPASYCSCCCSLNCAVLPARYTASQRCPIRRPACLLPEIHISSP